MKITSVAFYDSLEGFMNRHEQEDLRIQDLLGKVSGVHLKQLVRVLRALPLVLEHTGEEETANSLHRILSKCAVAGEYRAPLHSRPERPNYQATDVAYEAMVSDEEVRAEVEHIRNLTADPYYGAMIDGRTNNSF